MEILVQAIAVIAIISLVMCILGARKTWQFKKHKKHTEDIREANTADNSALKEEEKLIPNNIKSIKIWRIIFITCLVIFLVSLVAMGLVNTLWN